MLLSVADIANANRISTRWVQKLAARFGIGTRVGSVLVFTEAEAARFRGESPARRSSTCRSALPSWRSCERWQNGRQRVSNSSRQTA